MRRLLTTIAGVGLGGFLAGVAGIALALGLVHFRYVLDPPNGNDFQYLDIYLFAPFIELAVVGVTLLGAVIGGRIGFRWPDRRAIPWRRQPEIAESDASAAGPALR